MENSSYKTNRHSCFLLQYHLVVVTKYRHPVIQGELQAYLIEQTLRLFKLWGCDIIAINTDKDHIHIAFDTQPQIQLSKLINNYKTVTSRLVRKNFEVQLKPYYWKPYFWSQSYFLCTVSERSAAMIKAYIDAQGQG